MSVTRLIRLPLFGFTTRVPAAPHVGDVVSVVPFLSLARDLAALLVPVQPRPEFRANLERSLIATARQQHAQAALGAYGAGEPFVFLQGDGLERRWVIGAAAVAAVGSAVSIAGIVAYAIRRRNDRAA